MKRLDRRRFMMLSSIGAAGTVLAACGNDPDAEDLTPTMIPDVPGAPPTLAPVATPGGGAAAEAPAEEGPAEGGGGAGDAVTLEASDPAAWSTNELEVAPGQTISITNVGALPHDFTIDELSIAEVLDPGATVDVVFPEDATVGDTFTYYCSIPGHRELGMEGTLTVVEAGAAAPAAEGEDAAAGAAEDGAGSAEPIALEASDPAVWSLTEIEAAPGQVIAITNVGALPHDFTIDELSIAEVLDPGASVDVTVPDSVAAGETYTYYCSIPGHRELGMEGTLTIVEASAAAPAAAEGEGEAAGESEGAAAAGAGGSLEPVQLEASDPAVWSTNELEVAPGQTITITNVGVLPHDFTIDELSIAEPFDPGATIDVVFPEDAPVGETFTYYCSVPGHRDLGMEGTLTVVDAGGAAPAAAEGEAASETDTAASGDGGSLEPVALEASDPAAWSTTEIDAAPGQVIAITNVGALPHDFTVDELSIAEMLDPGAKVDVTIPEDATVGDSFTFYCSIPGHRELGMEGTLTIVEAGAAAPSAASAGESSPAAAASTPAAQASPAPVPEGAIELDALDPFNWSIKAIEAKPGDIIHVVNKGVLEHDFTVDELEIAAPLPSGAAADVTIPEDADPGEYEFYCSVMGHRESGMVGTLTIA